MKFSKKAAYIIFILLVSLLSTACKNKQKYTRLDIASSIAYLPANPKMGLGQILSQQQEFKPLEKNKMNHLSRLVQNEGDYIWLRLQFNLPQELKDKDLGLYIGHLRSAGLLFLNNISLRQYGEFPPNGSSAGYVTQYYMFPKSIIKQEETNTILIQVWPGAFGSISSKIYLSEQPAIFRAAERMTFFNSKITIGFAAVMILIFFMYTFLYFVMRKFSNSNVYFFYAMINFYTIHFLLPFFASEISWAKPGFLSYFMMLKIFFFGGAFSTVYFTNSFIISYLKYTDSKKIIAIRVGLWLIPTVITFAMPSYKDFPIFLPILIIPCVIQFGFSVPRIIKAILDPESDRRKDAIELLIGFAPVFVGVILDGCFKLTNINNSLPYFSIYGWQITIYIFLSQLLIRFGNMYVHNTALKNQLSEFNTHLEDVVALRTKELSEANYVLSKGLETVAHVQKNFLPPKNRNFRGWDLSISYTALVNNVSGDLYDYYFTDGVLDGVGIFDVSGHGIPAGLMTILAKSIISQHFITGKHAEEPLSNVLEDINKSYIKEKVNVENYITGLLFRFSEFNKKDVCSVEFANAGHPYPLLYSAADNTVKELKLEDAKQYGILGVEGLDVSFPPINFRAAQGDVIVCFTDGLTDCLNKHGEDFSKERIIKILQQHHNESSGMIMNSIMEKARSFTDGTELTDDITLIVLKRTNSKDYIEEI